MTDTTVKLVTREGGVPKERDPVAFMGGVVPIVPVVRQGQPTTVGDVLANASVLSAITGPDADWVIPANATHVVIPPLTASRTWSLPDVDTYPQGQELVVIDEGGYLGGANTIAFAPLAGSGDTISGSINNRIVLSNRFAKSTFGRGVLSDTWVVAGQTAGAVQRARTYVPEDPEFGAVGDGVVDDTQAFVRLGQALTRAGIGTVVLSRMFYVPLGWRVPSNIAIEGNGVGGIRHAGRGAYSGGIEPIAGGRGVRLTGVRVEAPDGIGRAEARFNIYSSGHDGLTVEDCATKFGLSGLWLDKCGGFTARRNRIITPVADGLHCAIGCYEGSVTDNLVSGSGDDAYGCTNDLDSMNDPALRTRSITFRNNTADDVRSGGGFMIYDGTDILLEANRGTDIAGPLWQIANHADSIYNERITLRGNYGIRVAQAVNSIPDALNPATVISNARTILVEGGAVSGVGGNRPLALFLNDFFDVSISGGEYSDIGPGSPSAVYNYSGTSSEVRMSGVGFARVQAPLDLAPKYGSVVSSGAPIASGELARVSHSVVVRHRRDPSPLPYAPYDAFEVREDGGTVISAPDISWTEAWQPGFTDRNQGGANHLLVISPSGRYGVSTAVRSSDNKTVDQLNVIGDNVMVVMDGTDRARRGWGRYTHGAITLGSLIEGFINDENSVGNYGATVPTDPYNINPLGQTTGLRIDSGFSDGGYQIPGAGGASPQTASVALSIVPNGAKFFAGIQFGVGALDTSLTGGIGHAVQLPAAYALVWQRATGFGNVDFRLYGDNSGGLALDGAGPVIIGSSTAGRLQIQGGASPVVSTTSGDLGLASAGGTIFVYTKLSAGAPVIFQPQSAPSSPSRGYTYYDDGLNKMRAWDGSAWQNLW